MCEVVNDDKVAKLSAAQQASYLRQMDDKNRNSKALARRALDQGIDFGVTLVREVQAMRRHVGELADIADADHITSFYSMESTLGGIRALVALPDEMLDEMEPTDILQLANIVGVPCAVPIGNFVDPMTWRVDRILPGVYLSLSAVLVAHVQSGGKALHAPGHPDVDVTNVIPIFDHPRIHHFLCKHAPSLLEYTASIGMRRVLADVPMTYAYTLAAGVWKMVEVLNATPSEVNIRLIKAFALELHGAFHRHFDYVLDVIVGPQDAAKSFYIANNGTTNMLDPLLQLLNPAWLRNRSKHEGGARHMARILRAIFNFEVYQVCRRVVKRDADPEQCALVTLHKLLNVDIAKHATPLQPLFVEEVKEPVHHRGFTHGPPTRAPSRVHAQHGSARCVQPRHVVGGLHRAAPDAAVVRRGGGPRSGAAAPTPPDVCGDDL